MMMRRPSALLFLLMASALTSGAYAQADAEDTEQMLTDLDAMIIGTQVTTRCALYDSSLDYLTPLEATGIAIRTRETEIMLAGSVESLADIVSEMRQEANAIPCGSQGLEPFLDFNRQIAQDVVEIALLVWATVEIEQCAYFVDDELLNAARRAKVSGEAIDLTSDPDRAVFIQESARAWIGVFAENCFNLSFEPAQTLPGLIALALPRS